MRTSLPAFIALRYLFSKKSHSAVGAITAVSITGMAVATAAMICVLSVFNGFRDLIGEYLDRMAPDIIVEPIHGKVIPQADSLAARLSLLPEIAVATPTLADNALIIANSHEMPVFLKGVVPEDYVKITETKHLIRKDEGRMLHAGMDDGLPETTVAIGIAAQLKIYPGDHILLFAPRRKGKVNMANPLSSFITDSLKVAGIFRANQSDYDENRLLVDLPTARRLFQYSDEASAIELAIKPGMEPEAVMQKISRQLGTSFSVKNRARQQEMNFRMIEIEKWVSFLLLGFILLIASFNIISSLSMLVLEKESSLSTLRALGMSERRIGSVFAWESIFVAVAGGICGIILGVILCLIQQHFGIIRIGDGASTLVPAYPVVLEWRDLLVTLLPVAAIGGLTAWITAAFVRTRINSRS